MEVDLRVVDGVVNLTGLIALVTGEGLKYFENGRAQFYALIVFVAVRVLRSFLESVKSVGTRPCPNGVNQQVKPIVRQSDRE